MSVEIWRPPKTASFNLNGAPVELIPLGPNHRALLSEAFTRLSERSRYYRFFSPVTSLSEHELTQLTDLDMFDRFAWGLLVEGDAAAVGRYAKTSTDPTAAEVAVTVLDDYQGRGLGRFLVLALAVVAANAGFGTLEFEVLSDNRPMRSILDELGAEVEMTDGIAHGRLAVANVPSPPVDPDLLLDVVGAARAVR
ncbi:MAG: GNAT family N-acetyltransferase [Acidimicrobiia bacterium]